MSPSRLRVVGAVATLTLVVGCAGGKEDHATPPAPASSSSTPSAGATRIGAAAWLDTLPVGRPPTIGYAIGHTYHAPDGDVVRLPGDFGITSITPLGEGYLVTSDQGFEGTTGIYRLDRRGRIDVAAGQPGHVPGAATVTWHPVLSADRRTVHWVTFTPPESGLSLPTLLHEGDVATGTVTQIPLDIGASSLTWVAGVVGEVTVVRAGWLGEAWIVRGTTEPMRAPWLRGASLVSPRSRLVAVRLGEDRAAGGVVDFTTRVLLWRRPHSSPMSFSPSGRRLLLASGRRVEVVDARTGEARLDLAPAVRGAPWSWDEYGWEDDRHLLAGLRHRDRAAVVRIDVDTGAIELAVDWTPTLDALCVAFDLN